MSRLQTALDKAREEFDKYMDNFECVCETCKHYRIQDCTKNLGCTACQKDNFLSHFKDQILQAIREDMPLYRAGVLEKSWETKEWREGWNEALSQSRSLLDTATTHKPK